MTGFICIIDDGSGRVKIDWSGNPLESPKNTSLKAYRQRAGLTQEQLAEQLNVTRVTVARWEVGMRKINRKSLRSVAAKTGIHPKDLRPDLVKLLGLD